MTTKTKKVPYTLNGHTLTCTTHEKNVGVIIQNDLKVSKHCQKVSKTCNQIIGQIKKSFINKEEEVMMKLYTTYILPHLDYGVSVWCPYLQKDIQLIAKNQRMFARMIKGTTGLTYTKRLRKLGIPTLEIRLTSFKPR